MVMDNDQLTGEPMAVVQTKKWIANVVIGCNFCPFAAKVMKQQTAFFRVEEDISPGWSMDMLMEELKRLNDDPSIETTFIIFQNAYQDFNGYLDMVAIAEKLLKKNGYEGVYQVASFHPLYHFAGAPDDDAADYTNRSPYPMLHILREDSITKALAFYKDPESIPGRNIGFAREKGLTYMKMLRDSCW